MKTSKKHVTDRLPANTSERDVHSLWLKARKGDLDAQRFLHDLVTNYPRAAKPLLERFVAQREMHLRGIYGNPKVSKPQSAWQRLQVKAGRYSTFVNGGLPSLGKRKKS